MYQSHSSLPPVPASLRALAARQLQPRADGPRGAALHLTRMATHLRSAQGLMLHRCTGPQAADFSRLLADYDASVQHLRKLLTRLRELRRLHAGTPGPVSPADPWLHPAWQPFLRESQQAVQTHLPPVFEAIQRYRAVCRGQAYRSQAQAA